LESRPEDFESIEEEASEESEKGPESEVKGFLSDEEVLASEIIGDKRLLAIFVRLGRSPCNPQALLSIKFYEVKRAGLDEEKISATNNQVLGMWKKLIWC
jgi:hypothetical protein